MGLSLKPKDAETGGGLLDDLDVVISKCRFGLWDYNGAIPQPIFALGVTFKDDDGNEAVQWYSAGKTEHHIPTDDGRKAQAVGKEAKGLHESTNAMLFIASLVNSGFPEDKIGDDVSVFEGTRVHVNRVPKPKSGFAPGGAAPKGDGKILVVTKVYETGEKPKSGAKAKAKVAEVAQEQAATATAQSNGAIPVKAQEAVINVLSAKGGSVAKNMLAAEIFKIMSKDPDRNAIIQMAFSDDFLGQSGQPWQFDGTTVSLG